MTSCAPALQHAAASASSSLRLGRLVRGRGSGRVRGRVSGRGRVRARVRVRVSLAPAAAHGPVAHGGACGAASPGYCQG